MEDGGLGGGEMRNEHDGLSACPRGYVKQYLACDNVIGWHAEVGRAASTRPRKG